jgi:uncharacterized protein (TIGR03435 family)
MVILLFGLFATGFQSPSSASLQFEVASIKPDPTGSGGGVGWQCQNGRCVARHVTLKLLIAVAYRTNTDEPFLTGGPNWVSTETYAIEAKAASASATQEQYAQMLQALLADRFKLSIKRETGEVAGYALVVADGGAKLSKSLDEEHCSSRRGLFGGRNAETNTIGGCDIPIVEFVQGLSRVLIRPVVDETSLPGKFDITLKWAPGDSERPPFGATGTEPNLSGPSIFTAIQEQLGLKLASRKVTIEVLRIDSAQKPLL